MDTPIKTRAKRILCVDDETEMLDLYRLIFARRGFEIAVATHASQALELVRSFRPNLILLDLMLPEQDGWNLYHQLKSKPETRDVKVVVVTAKAQSVDKVLAMQIAKVDDYIAKPFNSQELINRVERLLG